MTRGTRPGTMLLTVVAMIALAANPLLCRAALGAGYIDAASFAMVRVASGALLLFGAVQLTMFATAPYSGEHFPGWSWFGLGVAVAGMVCLVAPGVMAPDPVGAVLMVIAGIAWGAYSLLGRQAASSLEDTANNFIFAVPLVVAVSLLFVHDLHVTPRGLILAAVSGALPSGLGYVIWYAALRGLKATSAAAVQLSVPAVAAIGGVLLISEPVTSRLVMASVATLGGIAIVFAQQAEP